MGKKIQIYDPPMCCATGICGPSPDPKLVSFASDLDWLKSKNIEIERFNLSQQPETFTISPIVKLAMINDEKCLPLIIVDGKLVSKGKYLSRDELIRVLDIEPEQSMYTEKVEELVAIGAAIASNCESCFRFHYSKAHKLGISKDDILLAVETANAVKNTPAKAIMTYARKILLGGAQVEESSSSCCSPKEKGDQPSSSCCDPNTKK